MNSQSARTAGEHEPVLDDTNSSRQWETINDHMRQMSLWTEGNQSPLSTSPANRNIVTRPHNSQHNHLYRRSEGDIQNPPFELQNSLRPPQSAPILPEGYELNPNYYLNNFCDLSSATDQKENKGMNNQNSINNDTSVINLAQNSEPVKPELVYVNQTSHKDSSFNNPHSSKSTTRYNSRSIHSSVSSPSLPVQVAKPAHQYSIDEAGNTPTPAYPISHHMPSVTNYKNSPSSRRKSAPTPSSLYQGAPQIAISQSVQPAGIQRHSSASKIVNKNIGLPNFIEDIEESNIEAIVDDDREYTRVLLQHQRDRMHRLNIEYESKTKELNRLFSHLKGMEVKAVQRSSSSKPHTIPSLEEDVVRLREINRRLKIDCNCMYKEVELFSSYGDSTSDNFYSRYDRPKTKKKDSSKSTYSRTDLPPPPLPPPVVSNEEPKWRCAHCTFDNHAALNSCEICDYPRTVVS